MPTIIYNFKNKERLEETVAYLASRTGGIKMLTVPSETEHKLSVECHLDQVDEIRSLVNQLNESIKLNETTTKIIKMLAETIAGTGRTIRLMDGDVIRLTPAHAKAIVNVHDQLSEENQIALRTMVIENRQTHEAAIRFCLEQTKETE